MVVKRCPKCGAVWSSALLACAFCGVEGEVQAMSTHTGRLPEPTAPGSPPRPEPPPAPVSPAEATPLPPTSADLPGPKTALEPIPVEPKHAPVLEAKPAVMTHAGPSPLSPGPKPTLVPSGLKKPDPSKLPPAPRLPSSKLPIILGLLGLVACAILPVAVFVELRRIMTIMAYLIGASLLPLAPLSWFAGRLYEDRCIDLGFKPAALGRIGRLLGMIVTILISLEGSVLAFLAAVKLISAGK